MGQASVNYRQFMYQDELLQQVLWMNNCVDVSSFYISKWRDQV
jgi:hypothetical protein